jgi:xanthine dehydrogenase YagS FAD-binding subunit
VYPSDLAPALISLDAEATIATAKGDRTVPLEEFYTLPRVDVRKENILKANEILKEVKIPPPKNESKSTYVKAPIPWRLEKAENLLKGNPVTDDVVKQAAKEALSEARPLKENAYKQDLAAIAVSRAVLSLV